MNIKSNVNLKIVTLLITFILSAPTLSKEDDVGSWLMYFGTNKISDKFSIHTEMQFRNHTLTPNNTEQLLFRTGLNYHFSENKFVTAGYAYIPSYDYDSEQTAPETREHRIWQQYIANQKIGRVKLEHRFRYEQRWINGDYRDRLRYRMMLFIPLNKPVITNGTWFLGVYDEIFLNTEKTIFDRNRLYGALGYQFNKNLSLQMGMMHQRLNDFGKWYTQFGLVYNTDFSR